MAEYLASKVIDVALQEIGTTETGTNNVKYNTWLNGHVSTDPWCQAFIDWCFYTAYGAEGANILLCGNSKTASTMSQKDSFISAGRTVHSPKAGDIWWRKRSGGGHVGLVVKATVFGNSANIVTVEGNTSSSNSGSQWNGDGVFKKEHVIILNGSGGTDENGNQCWFGRPNYTGEGNLSNRSSVSIGLDGDYHGGGGRSFAQAQDDPSLDSLLKASDYTKTLNYTVKTYKAQFEDRTTEVIQDVIKTVDINDLGNGGYTNLLSYPSLIEVPFVQFKVGNYTFGKYTSESNGSSTKVDFPNYIKSLSITKINGQLNQYTLIMNYQISTGDDPNLLDRIFSSVGFGKVYITYGDYNCPTFIYKEEEAILTKVSSSVNFSNSSIQYTINCTSSALLLASNVFDFEKRAAKPSDVIFAMLKDSQYGLTDVFTGMANETQIRNNNLICTDDQEVEIEAKPSTDPITYIQYLVTCMSASTNGRENVLKDSTYRMTIHDDNFGDLNLKGCYFKITKINSSAKALATEGVYEVDVGYPNDNQVMSFSVNTDNSWQLLYNYSDTISTPTYTYDIDNDGNLVSTYSPSYAKSSSMNKMTETQKTWWTNMTQFPISATLTLKGLVRPTILMTYIRVNALFYGQRHDTSGLYIITGQKDSISESGYRTELALTRVAGDSDYIEKVKTQVTSKVLTGYEVEERQESVTIQGNKGLNDIKNTFSSIVEYVKEAWNSHMDEVAGLYRVDEDVKVNGNIYSNGDHYYTMWKILTGAGLTEAGAAGIIGNIKNEGGVPYRIQRNLWAVFCDPDNSSLYNFSDEDQAGEYITKMLDYNQLNPSWNKFDYTGPWNAPYQVNQDGPKSGSRWGYGLCQWTDHKRKKGLLDKAKSMGVSIGSWEAQTQYILDELNSDYKPVLNILKSSGSVEECSNAVFNDYEKPRDSTGPARVRSSKEIYNTYKGR